MSTSTRSRYPSPGTDSSMWWDDRPAEPVVILATSRHKRSITVDEAKSLLAECWVEWADATADLSTVEVVTWRSVTEADKDIGMIGEADPGDWHTEGTGSAWVTVLRCDATPQDGAE